MATARFFYKDPDAPSPNHAISVGVLALIDSAGALLMDRRSDCGRWGLPGGAIAPDEALEGALVREVREETGLAMTKCELFCISADPSRIALPGRQRGTPRHLRLCGEGRESRGAPG